MDAIANLVVVMTILSVAAERMTNILKMRHDELRLAKPTPEEERTRVYGITLRSMGCGVFIALLVKADLFAILNNLDDPFATLGWVHVDNYKWTRSLATATWPGGIYAVIGCVLTGIGLGFGSKFWHDILGAIYELRSIARNRKEQMKVAAPAAGGGDDE